MDRYRGRRTGGAPAGVIKAYRPLRSKVMILAVNIVDGPSHLNRAKRAVITGAGPLGPLSKRQITCICRIALFSTAYGSRSWARLIGACGTQLSLNDSSSTSSTVVSFGGSPSHFRKAIPKNPIVADQCYRPDFHRKPPGNSPANLVRIPRLVPMTSTPVFLVPFLRPLLRPKSYLISDCFRGRGRSHCLTITLWTI